MLANTIEVEIDPTLIDNDDAMGKAKFRSNKILLVDKKKHNVPDIQMETTFMHEMIHFAFSAIKEDDLRDNEKLVDLLANVLVQAFNSMEY